MDGCLDVWDYFYKQNDPTLQVNDNLTSACSTCLALAQHHAVIWQFSVSVCNQDSHYFAGPCPSLPYAALL